MRCTELGLSMGDLAYLDMGMIFDMFTEKANDEYNGWQQVATQKDFDRF